MNVMPFDPAATLRVPFFNRDKERELLANEFTRYLQSDEAYPWQRVVLGKKGVGKTMVVRRLLSDLREVDLGARDKALVYVDCRPQSNAREVLQEVADGLANELQELSTVLAAGSTKRAQVGALAQWASFIRSVASYTEASLKTSDFVGISRSLNLGFDAPFMQGLVGFVTSKLSVNLQLTSKSTQQLDGQVRVDPRRLLGWIGALVTAMEEAGVRTVLLLDNMDELKHETRDADELEAVKHDVGLLLQLTDLSLGAVFGMRDYYASVIQRRATQSTPITNMGAQSLIRLLDERLVALKVSEEALAYSRAPACRSNLEKLAQIAPTPLVFLTWFSFLASDDTLDAPDLFTALTQAYAARYSTIPMGRIEAVARLFDGGAVQPRAKLLDACDGNEARLGLIVRQQLVLPLDFWVQHEFTLDPELAWFTGRDVLGA